MTPLWAIFVVPAVVLVLSIPMALEKVPPNGFYGFRTPKTMSSRELWYEANRLAGVYLALAGFFGLLISTALVMKELPDLALSINIGLILAAVIASFVRLAKL